MRTARGGSGQALSGLRPHPGEFRIGAFYRSSIADNNSFEQWSGEGGLDANQRANLLWKKMLTRVPATGTRSGYRRGLKDYIAEKNATMPDANS
jgi:trimethylamine---corrinoid protein Co-methyltransferase